MRFLGKIKRLVRYGSILKYVEQKGQGLEIGPSYNPIAPKRLGYNVHIMDHKDKQGLIDKYVGFRVPIENIEEVDFIWQGEKYADLIGKTKFYDWIIASHVVEHTPDLISFLNDCDVVLKETGVLILAVPDATRCFDYFRQLTSIAQIVDAYLNNHRLHTIGTAVEQVLNYCTMDDDIAWNWPSAGNFRLVNTTKDAKEMLETLDSSLNFYQDCHAWCFTPHSFRLMIEDLFELDLIRLREIAFFTTGSHEFFIVLGREGKGPLKTRLQLNKVVKRELAQSNSLTVTTWWRMFCFVRRVVMKLIRGR